MAYMFVVVWSNTIYYLLLVDMIAFAKEEDVAGNLGPWAYQPR